MNIIKILRQYSGLTKSEVSTQCEITLENIILIESNVIAPPKEIISLYTKKSGVNIERIYNVFMYKTNNKIAICLRKLFLKYLLLVINNRKVKHEIKIL